MPKAATRNSVSIPISRDAMTDTPANSQSSSENAQNGGRLAGRIALVTGASRGLGYAVAKRYAAEGAHVIAVARTVGGLEELDDEIKALGGTATLVPLDLTDGPKVDQMGGAIAERFGRLDIMVANAGLLGQLSPMSHQDPDTWEKVMAVNVNANWRLIRAFDALLRASDAGRAIFVTSRAARAIRAYWGAYATSKAALDAMVKTYAAELEKTNLRANLLDPGALRTAMRAKAYPGEPPGTANPPDAITDLFVRLASPDCTDNGKLFEAQPTD